MKKPELKDLTLREKVAQLLMVNQSTFLKKSVEGSTEKVARSQAEIDEITENTQYGSVWWHGNVVMQIIDLANDINGGMSTIKENADWIDRVTGKLKIPAIIGVDCERGAGDMLADATPTGSGFTVGACDNEELIYDLYRHTAQELKAANIHWRWGPVVDLPNRFCGVTVGRSLSDDPEKLIRLARAAIQGTQSAGVAACAKHFPGCDPYEYRDSHLITTQINVGYDEWKNTQAKTFQAMIDAGVWSVMIGHTVFPDVDNGRINGKPIPATLSEKVIKGVLREKMGFDGVVITDGLVMAGLMAMCPWDEILIHAINAGNDILLGVNPEDYETIYQAVLDGKISEERIDESCQRVLDFKEKLGLFEEKEVIDIEKVTSETRELAKTVVEKSITMVCNKNNLVPLSKEKIKKVTIVISAHNKGLEHNVDVMKEEFEKRGAEVKVYTNAQDFNWGNPRKIIYECDLIVYAAHVGIHAPVGMPSLYDQPARVFMSAFTYGNEKSIGVSTGYPYVYHDFMEAADTYFNIYSKEPASQVAFVQTLYGEIPFNTESPIDLEPKLRMLYC